MAKKSEEISNPNSCWNKAREDEMVFVLLERDIAFPATVTDWAGHRVRLGKNKEGDPQIEEALRCAGDVLAKQTKVIIYRTKPITVAAFQMTQNRYANRLTWPDWLKAANMRVDADYARSGSLTLVFNDHLVSTIHYDDWIVRDGIGNFSVCKPAYFTEKFEAVNL